MRRFVAAGVVLVVAVGVAGWWFFLRDDAPDEANIDDATQVIEDEGSGSDSATDDTGDAAAAIDGAWNVDTTIGSFDDNFSSSYAGYRIQEELASIGANVAVGRTPDVSGSATVAGNQVTDASFEADMTTLRSDEGQRDNQLRGRGLETDSFPTATFTLTQPVDLPADAGSGDQIAFTAIGDLTLHGVTNSVTIDFEASLTDDIIAVVGSAPVVLADYDIEPPEGFSVVSVADDGTFEFQLFLTQS